MHQSSNAQDIELGPSVSDGPWMLDKYDALGLDVWRHVIRAEKTGFVVASIHGGDGQDPPPYAHAMGVARELLAALKEVVAIADRKTIEFDRARAAIAKAEGRES